MHVNKHYDLKNIQEIANDFKFLASPDLKKEEDGEDDGQEGEVEEFGEKVGKSGTS
jgi:hypothetical protein